MVKKICSIVTIPDPDKPSKKKMNQKGVKADPNLLAEESNPQSVPQQAHLRPLHVASLPAIHKAEISVVTLCWRREAHYNKYRVQKICQDLTSRTASWVYTVDVVIHGNLRIQFSVDSP